MENPSPFLHCLEFFGSSRPTSSEVWQNSRQIVLSVPGAQSTRSNGAETMLFLSLGMVKQSWLDLSETHYSEIVLSVGLRLAHHQ